jgi:hypothetical protein
MRWVHAVRRFTPRAARPSVPMAPPADAAADSRPTHDAFPFVASADRTLAQVAFCVAHAHREAPA